MKKKEDMESKMGNGGGNSSEKIKIKIKTAMDNLREDVKALAVPCEIPRISGESLTALQFHRDYVAKNQPVIITGCLSSWPAMRKWQDVNYLATRLQHQKVTVDLTPDGYGDSVTPDGSTFVTPAQQKMPFGRFAHMLTNPQPGVVAYCQKQNGNFNEEFKPLIQDTKRIDWAFDAFGAEPDAVNMWIGDQRSVSSLHRDPYENVYCVIKGQKRFTLLPPTDGVYLAEQEFPGAQYRLANQEKRTTTTTTTTTATTTASLANDTKQKQQEEEEEEGKPTTTGREKDDDDDDDDDDDGDADARR